jgi:hypothetical protein
MAVTMKRVFLDVMPFSLVEVFHFRGTCCIHLGDRRVSRSEKVPPKQAISNKLHGITTQMTVFFTIPTVCYKREYSSE